MCTSPSAIWILIFRHFVAERTLKAREKSHYVINKCMRQLLVCAPSTPNTINSLRRCVLHFAFVTFRFSSSEEVTEMLPIESDKLIFRENRPKRGRRRMWVHHNHCEHGAQRSMRVNDFAALKLTNVTQAAKVFHSLRSVGVPWTTAKNFKSDVCGQTKSDYFVLWAYFRLSCIFQLAPDETF